MSTLQQISSFGWTSSARPAIFSLLLGFLLVCGSCLLRPAFAVDSFSLSTYQPGQLTEFSDWRMSEKFDGVRAIWDGKQLQTRNGHPIAAPDWFVEKLPEFAVDGELWVAPQAFSTVSSIVLTQTPDARWQKVFYKIFEVPNQPGGLTQRLQVLQTYLAKRPVSFLQLIPQYPIQDQAALDAFYQQVIAQGGEGIVIRNAAQKYATGRLRSALKYKPVMTAECQVTGYTEGKGQFTGMVGALKCALLAEQIERLFPKLMQNHQPVMIRLGSGLTTQLRQAPPEIGEVVTFEYSGWTKTGLPRFARFKQLRPNATLFLEQ